MRRRAYVAALLLSAVVAAAAGQAQADSSAVLDSGTVGGASSGFSYPSSPRSIEFDLGSAPTGEITVTLIDAATQTLREPTGTGVVVDGRRVTVHPPNLEAGTYLLSWSYPSQSMRITGAAAVHVGPPTAAVLGSGERTELLPAAIGLALIVVGALLVALGQGAVDFRTRRSSQAVHVDGELIFAAPAGKSAAARLGWVIGPGVLLGALGGAALSFGGASPWLTGVLGAAGGGGAAVLLGYAVARLGRASNTDNSAFAAAPADAGNATSSTAGTATDSAADKEANAAATGSERGRVRVALLVATGGAALLGIAAALARQPLWSDRAGDLAGVGLVVLGTIALLLSGTLLAQGRGGRGAAAGVAVGVVAATAGSLLIAPEALAKPFGAERQVSAVECLTGGSFLEQAACLDAAFSATVRTAGPKAALDALKQAREQVPQINPYCHETSHAIGRSSVAYYGGSVADAFEGGYDVCDFGYYHGIIEGAAGGMSDSVFAQESATLCRDLATSTEVLYFQCFHGLGHAAARRTNNNLERGLAMCDAIGASAGLREQDKAGALNGCGTGVTMEWFSVAQKAGLDYVEPRVGDIRQGCLVVAPHWREACVEYLANTLDTSRPAESLAEISSWCQENTAETAACLRGIARTAAALSLPAGEVTALCESAGSASAAECIEAYLIYRATTVAFDVGEVAARCAEIPEKFRLGVESACARAEAAARGVLASLDGKAESFANNTGVQ